MAVVHDPSSAGKMVFGDGFTGDELVEAVGVEDKIKAISGKIASRLGNAADLAKNVRDSELSGDGTLALLRPWLDQEVPENVVSSCEQQYFANERVISALFSHLVEHIVIGEDLRLVASAARRRASDELQRIPPVMIDFVNRLMASGVVVDDVWKMSKKRLGEVVAAIKGVDPSAVMADVDAVPGNTFSSEDGRTSISRKSDADSEDAPEVAFEPVSEEAVEHVDSGRPDNDADALVEGSVHGLIEDSEGVGSPSETSQSDGSQDTGSQGETGLDEPSSEGVEEPAEQVIDTPSEPVRPKGRWDDLDLSALGYSIEETVASSDADREALRMTLPAVTTLRELALPRSAEMAFMDGIETQKDRVIMDKFIRRFEGRMNVRISEMEKRVIALLLVDLPTNGAGRQMGANGWYDGIVLPGAEGSSRVRRIVAIDRSEAGLRDAFA